MKIKHKYFKDKGRGVIATKNIKKGEVIERAPVIVIPSKEWKHIKKTILNDWNYYWKRNGDFAIVLGHGSLYNHSFTPNAYYKPDFKNNAMVYIALKNIKINEEILINYNGDPEDMSPMWFDVK